MSDEKPKEDRTPGIVSWNELMTPDTEASKNFYGGLFGWTSEDMPMPKGTYSFFSLGERPAAGMIQIRPDMGEVAPSWLMYVTVEDLDASLAKAKDLGAQVCVDATDLPMGRFAVIADPQGAMFGLWQFAESAEC